MVDHGRGQTRSQGVEQMLDWIGGGVLAKQNRGLIGLQHKRLRSRSLLASSVESVRHELFWPASTHWLRIRNLNFAMAGLALIALTVLERSSTATPFTVFSNTPVVVTRVSFILFLLDVCREGGMGKLFRYHFVRGLYADLATRKNNYMDVRPALPSGETLQELCPDRCGLERPPSSQKTAKRVGALSAVWQMPFIHLLTFAANVVIPVDERTVEDCLATPRRAVRRMGPSRSGLGCRRTGSLGPRAPAARYCELPTKWPHPQ